MDNFNFGLNVETGVAIWTICKTGLLAMFGGVSAYLYKCVRKDSPIQFSWLTFIIMCILAYFMGVLIGDFIPPAYESKKDGIIMLCGYCSYPICALLESKYKSIFYKFMS